MNAKPVHVDVSSVRELRDAVRIVRDPAQDRAEALAELAAAAELAAMAAPLPSPAVRDRLRSLLITAARMDTACKPRAERKAG